LTYLTLIRRLRGHVADAHDMAQRTWKLLPTGQMLEYIAMARANMAWVAWREAVHDEAAGHAEAALELWRQTPVSIHFNGQHCFHSLQLRSITANCGCSRHARALLSFYQQLLPQDIVDALQWALDVEPDEHDWRTIRYRSAESCTRYTEFSTFSFHRCWLRTARLLVDHTSAEQIHSELDVFVPPTICRNPSRSILSVFLLSPTPYRTRASCCLDFPHRASHESGCRDPAKRSDATDRKP
jgi:hypothetical protein